MSDPDSLSRAHQPLASGQIDEARIYLEKFLRQDPDNLDLLLTRAFATWTSASLTRA
jgi:hypothetical protein